MLARDVGGQEDPGLYLQHADGGPLTEVHHKKGTRAGYGFSTRDAKTICFTANDIAPDSYAIYRYDIAAGERELVFDQPGLWMIADHREGQGGALTLLLAKATGALSREFAEYDVAHPHADAALRLRTRRSNTTPATRRRPASCSSSRTSSASSVASTLEAGRRPRAR